MSHSSGSALSAFNTDQPSRSGMMMSSVITSGRACFASLRPSRPPAACRRWYPAPASSRSSRSWVAFSSSTIRTVPPPDAVAARAALSATSALASGAMAGTLIAKVEPLPGVLSTVTSPPSMRQKCLVMARPEPGPAVIARGRGLCLRERLEQPGELLRRHANPGIRHLELHHVGPLVDDPAHASVIRPRFCELGSVAQEVEQALAQLGLIGAHRARHLARSPPPVCCVLGDQRFDHRLHLVRSGRRPRSPP